MEVHIRVSTKIKRAALIAFAVAATVLWLGLSADAIPSSAHVESTPATGQPTGALAPPPKSRPCKTVTAKVYNRRVRLLRAVTDSKRGTIVKHKQCKSRYKRLGDTLRPLLRNCRGGTPAQNRCLGRRMAAARGWKGEQWRCLDNLWGVRESGWRTSNPNPTSGADGIPQALPPSKMGDGWEGNPRQQIAWGLSYIKGRYGTPCAALAHSYAAGWY